MSKKTVKDVALAGKRVLMRVDFNVPLDENQRVTSDKRIRAAVPTIEYILDQGGRLVLMSHLGRPKGKVVPEMSLKPCVEVLSGLIGKPVRFAADCVGEEVIQQVDSLADGEVLLLENLRFHAEETDNDPEFSRQLAGLAEVYANDAFGTAHRAHASTEGVTSYVGAAVSGFLLEKELKYLVGAVENPERPFVAVLGGAKISGKIDVISNLLPKVDKLIVGGGMAYTFFKAQGKEIGNSLLEEDKVELASSLLEQAGDKLMLPVDCLICDQFDFGSRKIGQLKAISVRAIPRDWEALDIGPASAENFSRVIAEAGTVVWNGPMGVFEIKELAGGTEKLARAIATATDNGATSIIGGGDSVAAVEQMGLAARMTHISTGGGASLELLQGKELPGVAALDDA
ncbi:MAG: phosphoglycerate kinase [Candidatus Glassbacteria bacterium]|nr:phosphoglycerate kinase [Candidatus Glassbacteria bacterium]